MRFKELLPSILAVVVTLGFFIMLGIVVFHTEPAGNEQFLNILFGILAAKFASVIDYHFGSSSGSAAKTQILADQAKK